MFAHYSHNFTDVPHSWLFAKCSAAVHHGGSGTMHAALAAGLPSLVVRLHLVIIIYIFTYLTKLPVLADQPFNGDIIYRNKLGPQPIPIKKLNLIIRLLVLLVAMSCISIIQFSLQRPDKNLALM
jgi:hypothetical protein